MVVFTNGHWEHLQKLPQAGFLYDIRSKITYYASYGILLDMRGDLVKRQLIEVLLQDCITSFTLCAMCKEGNLRTPGEWWNMIGERDTSLYS